MSAGVRVTPARPQREPEAPPSCAR
jgi:hypothetical protein